jgi:hypothetical protein
MPSQAHHLRMMILPVSGSATFSIRRSLCHQASDRADSAQE